MNETKLLEGLAGEGIKLNVRNLAKFTAENGILVQVRCGRRRGRVSLPPKLLGLRPEKWEAGNQNFFETHVQMGQLTLVPKEMDLRLNQLDTRVRRLVQTYSVNGSYMPLSVYSQFREEFEEIRKEYLEVIEEVAQAWDSIRTNFTKGVTDLVNTMGKRAILQRDRETFVRGIISSIPTAAAYRGAAYMELEVRAFPTTGVTSEGLAPDIQDVLNRTWRDDVVSNAVKSIETSIGQVFAQTCRTAEIYAKTGKMDQRNINSLSRIADRVTKLNVFANPMLAKLGKRLAKLSGMNDEQLEDVVESAILDTVEYAKSTGINLDMSVCPFTERQLNDMLDLRAKYEKEA